MSDHPIHCQFILCHNIVTNWTIKFTSCRLVFVAVCFLGFGPSSYFCFICSPHLHLWFIMYSQFFSTQYAGWHGDLTGIVAGEHSRRIHSRFKWGLRRREAIAGLCEFFVAHTLCKQCSLRIYFRLTVITRFHYLGDFRFLFSAVGTACCIFSVPVQTVTTLFW